VTEPYVSPYVDDPDGIPDDAVLYRRIKLPDWVDWSVRNEANQPRIKGWAFQDWRPKMAAEKNLPGPAMSAGLKSILEAHGYDASRMIDGLPGYAVAGLTAAKARAIEQGITGNPTDEEPWHTLVFCLHRKAKNDAMEVALAEAAFWVIAPDPPDDAAGDEAVDAAAAADDAGGVAAG
jgi:hypothetical protein